MTKYFHFSGFPILLFSAFLNVGGMDSNPLEFEGIKPAITSSYIQSRYNLYRQEDGYKAFLEDGDVFLVSFDDQAFSDWFRYFWLAKEQIIPWSKNSFNNALNGLIKLSDCFYSRSMKTAGDFIRSHL